MKFAFEIRQQLYSHGGCGNLISSLFRLEDRQKINHHLEQMFVHKSGKLEHLTVLQADDWNSFFHLRIGGCDIQLRHIIFKTLR